MDHHNAHHAAATVPIRRSAGHLKLGLWVRLGIAGTWVGLARLAMLLGAGQESSAFGALAALGGGTLAAIAWRRVTALGAMVDRPPRAVAAVEMEVRGRPVIRSPAAPRLGILSLLRR